ncbi:MAG: cache domain-containing protein [Oscillospiraceae bacterium]|jgi:signal transduction histidine kinase/CheY-like chemotaxis protein/HPt (histidine-containing phosphotransfer) domain-containing protein|nr:cache domain-containing protein [Oscillospiraceae bacterium]
MITITGIKAKILLPAVIIVLTVAVSILLWNIRQFSVFVDTSTVSSVDTATKVALSALDAMKAEAAAVSLSISRDPVIIRAAEEGNRGVLLARALSAQENSGAEFCTLTDPDGRVIARTHSPEETGDLISSQVHVRSAMNGEPLSAIEEGSAVRLSVCSGTPILNSQGEVIGVVSAGFRLDTNRFVDKIKEMIGCEVTVVLGDERISTTVLGENGERVVGTKADAYIAETVLAGNTYSGRVDILGRIAVCRYTPIYGANGQAAGMLFIGQYLNEELKTIWDFVRGGGVITAVMLAASLSLLLIVVGHIVKPIRAMTRAASALAAGDTELEIRVNTKDETRTLADAFNSMIQNTRRQVQTVEDIANGGLSFPLQPRSEKDLMNRALEKLSVTIKTQAAAIRGEHARVMQMLETVKKANTAKSDFLASMSHEMRTPLNAIIGLSEIALDSEEVSGNTKLNLEKIYNSGSTLLSIVNDILDISKIQSGKFEILPDTYDVPSLINDSVLQNILRIGSRPIRFVLNVDGNLPARLYGDSLRVKQIISNLLSNAFKYTEEGLVELGLFCERDGDSVWMTVRVSDTGTGIRRDHLERLFAEFEQFGATSYHQAGGTGLGLSITKSLAEMMGGTVSVESVYGKGSVFTVRLRQGRVNNDVIGDKAADSLKRFQYSVNKLDGNARVKRLQLPYARVLLVDDNITNLDVAKGLMKPYGMRIDCVSGGLEAIRAIREEKARYSAVFMDHMMPGIDGIEAARIIREEIGTEYAKTVPIIALTANAVTGSEEMFLNSGFQAFISKPIDLEKLDAVLHRWVRDKSLETGGLCADGDAPESGGAFEQSPGGGLSEIEGINSGQGIKHSGSKELFVKLIRDFYRLIDLKSAQIETSVAEGRISDVTVLAHALKTSAQIIGAEELAEAFHRLEILGGEGDLEALEREAPAVLARYRGFRPLLQPFAGAHRRGKGEMSGKELVLTLKTLISAAGSFDLDGVDEAVNKLEGLRFPGECQTQADMLGIYAADLNMNGLIKQAQELLRFAETLPEDRSITGGRT